LPGGPGSGQEDWETGKKEDFCPDHLGLIILILTWTLRRLRVGVRVGEDGEGVRTGAGAKTGAGVGMGAGGRVGIKGQ